MNKEKSKIGKKILIVEDELIIAEEIKLSLKHFGYDVLGPVTNSESAIEAVKYEQPDLILMDISLRGKTDGIETASIIRNFADVPVVFLSANSDEKTISRAKLTEPYGYLVKPFQRSELYSTIEPALYRHSIEKKLKQSEDRFRIIAENVNDVIWTMNLEKKFTYVSPSVISLIGYSANEVIDLSIEDLMTKENYEYASKLIEEKFRILSETNMFPEGKHVVQQLHKNGSKIWVEIKIKGLYDKNNICYGIIGISRDITDHIRLENSLKKLAFDFSSLYGKELFYKVTEHLCQSLNIDIAFIGEYINDENKVRVLGGNWDGSQIDNLEYEIEGSPCETVIGKNVNYYPNNVAKLFPRDQILTDEKIDSYCGIPLFDKQNKPLGIIVLLSRSEFIDVELAKSMLQIYSERISLEMQNWEMIEELKRSEEKFKTVADLTYDWEFWMDADNNLIYSSPSCERITGYTREEFFANPNLLSSIIIKEDHLIWNKHLISEGENKQEEIDVRIICKNGQVKWINHICYTLVDKDGKILGRRASNRDITERKKMDNFIVIQRDLNIDLMIVDNLADAYKIIFKYASKIEGIDCGWICLLNKERGFELKESFELSEQSVKYIANHLIATKQYKLILKGNPIYKNTSELFDVNIETASNKNISIVASIPFKDENKTTGVINFGSSILIEFTENLKNIIETFVFQAGSYLNRIIAEHELIESEEKYKNFFETDLTADIKSTVDGIILDCNPAFVKMFEFDSKEEALKTPISYIYFNKTSYIDIIKELQKKKKLESVNRTLKTKKGNEIEVVENILGEFDENGRLVHINSFMFDITKIRLVENALVESERRYRELFERMQNGFALHEIILNKNGKPLDYIFLAVNPTFEKMTGLKATKLIGKRALEVLPNTEKYWIDIYGKVALTGQPNTFENYSRELGKYYRVFSYSPEKMKFAVLIEDITETRKSEEKIKQLSAAVEQSPVSIIITDLTGRIEYVNAMFSKLTGYNKDEVLGKETSILKSGYTTKTEYKKLWKTIISGKDWNGIFRNKKKNGELFWESANISAIRNPDGKITHFVAIKEDITEKVRIESELEMHRNKLEVLVEQRTKELNEVNKKLKQEIEKEKEFEMMLQQSLAKEKELSELKSRFISTTSHEFRTPLTSVLSSAELIHRYGKKWSDEKLAYHTAKIKNSIEYLTNLLDDVLTISRSESGKIVFDPTLINLKSICEELIDESWTQASTEHKINFVFKPQQSKYYLDPKLIRFIIINLLSNAIKYTPNGGLIKFTVEERNGNILLIISDNGIGIPPEEIPRLFEPFSRAQNTIEIPGTGLGLSIVKRAVDLHSGIIKIESDLNKGAKFIIQLPLNSKNN